MKKVVIIVISAVILLAVPFSALAAPLYGAAAVDVNKTYTLPEMLTYAIEDEYLAQARYENVISKFGAGRPFTNILRAETMHIAAVKPLFEMYNVPLPENDARNYLAEPATLSDAFRAGITGEINNINMYNAFLKQNIPSDVRAVFTALRNASERHLAAFQNGLSRLSFLS
jgi:hypothetical protein